jgi:choline kinase
MRAIMLAAGVGQRLFGGDPNAKPKSLLEFAGKTLIERHLAAIKAVGISDLTLVVGYRADELRAAIRALDSDGFVSFVENPDYREGSSVSLWCAREVLRSGTDVIFMDADVLYHTDVLGRLTSSAAPNCLSYDDEIEPGDEPVKICLKEGKPADFGKIVGDTFDGFGEWVGFLKLTPRIAGQLADRLDHFMQNGGRNRPMEDAVRELIRGLPPGTFGIADVTDLPWIEIDFPEDVAKARDQVLPSIEPQIESGKSRS